MNKYTLSLEGQVAIITGGTRGIGRAITLAFAEAGADVAFCNLSGESEETVSMVEEIRRLGSRFLALKADVSRKNEVDSMVNRVIDDLGGVDILVNNAAHPVTQKPVFEINEDEWNQDIDTNLKGCYLCCQAVTKSMIKRRNGNIINLASIGGLKADRVGGAYGISKAGVVMLTRSLAAELGPYNIRVNTIIPGTIKTDRTRIAWENPEELNKVEATIPLRRIGQPDDVAGVAVFLASQIAGYITGQIIIVDGGVMAT